MAGVITASEPSWRVPFTGLSPRQFTKLVTTLRRTGSLPPAGAGHGVCPGGQGSAGHRVVAHGYDDAPACPAVRYLQVLGRPRHRPPRSDPGAAASAPLCQMPCSLWTAPWCPPATTRSLSRPRTTGTPPTTRSSSTPTPAGSSWSGQPLPGNRNDCKAWEQSGAKAAVGRTLTNADGGYPGTGLVMPHRRRAGEELPDWKQEHNRSHTQVRARVEHTFARMKTWKILRDCGSRATGSITPCSASPTCTTSAPPDRRVAP